MEHEIQHPLLDARRAAWLEDRKKGIGGSEVAALLLPPEHRPEWCSPIRVWLDKTGQLEDEDRPQMRSGRRLERTILEMYADDTKQPIEFADGYDFLRDPQLPILGASLDARLLGGDRRPVDAKNIRFKNDKYGPAGSDRIPLYYACQLHTQILVTGSPCADLAVLFSGQDLERFTVERDEETIEIIRERVSAWWEKHIVGGEPPEPDGSPAFADYLSKRFNGGLASMVEPDDSVLAIASQLADARKAAAKADIEKTRLEDILKGVIGENRGITGVCTWARSKDTKGTNWEAAARSLAERLFPLLPDPSPYPDAAALVCAIAAEFEGVTKRGSRRFLFTFKED